MIEQRINTVRNSVIEKVIRVLILEDRGSDADLIEFELQEAGIAFTSHRVEKERDYVRALQEFSPDLILSDYDLPQYNGALALVAAKKLRPEVPFILVTGAIDENDGPCGEILVQGARECILKDHLERLAPAVRKALGENGGHAVNRGLLPFPPV
ncbi:MAG: response regulator [Proteobacteria bacterium]|nr:response regulator [Pseudomonadota bacterium]